MKDINLMTGKNRESESPKLKQESINRVFETLAQIMPEPKTELHYENPYTLLVAVALSAQATDVSVNKATKDLFKKVKTPQNMLDLEIATLIDHIKTIGLYNTKAKNIMAAAEILTRDYNGNVPEDRDILETLPGVGRKTANVVVNEAFGQPTIAVDTHIFRVANRTGMAVATTPNKVEQLLELRVPDIYKKNAHHWLILHGRYTCVARKPKCGACPIIDDCNFKNKTPF
jgi:endonuclease-3